MLLGTPTVMFLGLAEPARFFVGLKVFNPVGLIIDG